MAKHLKISRDTAPRIRRKAGHTGWSGTWRAMTLISSGRPPTSSAYICLNLPPRQHAAVVCVDENPPSKHWTGWIRCCQCRPVESNVMDSNTTATAPFRFMPRSMCERAGSAARRPHGIHGEEFVEFLGQVVPTETGDPHHPGQPLGTQTPQSSGFSRRTSQRASPLHTDLFFPAESG